MCVALHSNSSQCAIVNAHIHFIYAQMALPTNIYFDGINTASLTTCVYIAGRSDAANIAEPDFLYIAQPPIVSVNGIGFGTNYILGYYSGGNFAGGFKPDDIILCNGNWQWYGSVSDEPNGSYIYGSLSGFANVPLSAPFYGSGTFFVSGINGVNEMAGKLGKYIYTIDGGASFTIRMDVSNAATLSNPAAAPSAVVNLPGAFRPRYLLCEQTDERSVKRRIVVCNPGNANYLNGGSIQLETINGSKAFIITGRVGEKASF